jgi:hypothetical protein
VSEVIWGDSAFSDRSENAEYDDFDSWAPIDLGPYLRGEVVRPTPTVGIARADGLRMLYPGKEHAVIGEMESGKSWFALASAAAELDAGNTVDYLHFEESDPSDTVDRLQALGVRPYQIEKLFRFVAPQRKVSVDALKTLLDPAPTLVILDGVNEAMSMHGWGIREEDGAAQFRRHLVMPCTRVGAAVLSCDHVVKDAERRGRNAIGSIHKGNGLSGSLILLENAEPFGRGMKGRSHVYVTKDRPGHLRSNGKADKKMPGKTYMGSLMVDDEQVYSPDLVFKFWAPNDEPLEGEMPPAAQDVDDHVVATVKSIVDKGQDANTRAVRAMAGCRAAEVDAALERLVITGRLQRSVGKRGARLFTVSGDQLSESAE